MAWQRLPFLVFGFVALVVGVGAGLARLGWAVPAPAVDAAALHGPLMVCGFFGVVISLERAVAIGRPWAYAAPLLAALGSAAALHGAAPAAPWLYLGAGVLLLAASADVLRRQSEGFNVVIALAAGCWAWGTAAWALGTPVHGVLGWWLAFLVLTIAGERLELSRFMPPSVAATRLFAAVVLLLLAALAAWRWPLAQQALGAALLGLAAWLLRHDIARRTVRQRGLTRYIAVCLLAGYFWLGLGGAVILVAGLGPGGAAYDAALHALLLGFVFSMVFGHAPIIFPAVLRVAMPYHAAFYAPLVLLHASVALRAGAAAAGAFEARRWAAMLSALALLAFIATMASAVARGRSARRAG
ncbi:MAG: hypothetical protein HZC37_23010 [Burkholderiales bacterium]|nr:hypothetical protein [Burkholderiales bacterium]